jgi:light-regulated signal transduction histidine kinase (bacteriophytochrome)
VETGETYRVEYRLWDRRANGYCWYLGRALPVRDEAGGITKWIGTCTDIDEQKGSEEDLRRANRALEQFAFAASHDLQEPLRNVAVYCQLFEKNYGSNLNQEATMFLGTITEGAQRISRLVSDVLEYMQTASLDDAATTVVSSEKVLEQALGNLAYAVQESEATITHDTLPPVSMKDVHLLQLLQNLIGNAIKYRRDGEPPQVHVSALQQGSQWHFVVQDNGIGIAPEYRDHVFGVFKRLHASREKYSGTGIGLAICQKIVESYGGRIWVESELGQGTAFHFTVPGEGRG